MEKSDLYDFSLVLAGVIFLSLGGPVVTSKDFTWPKPMALPKQLHDTIKLDTICGSFLLEYGHDKPVVVDDSESKRRNALFRSCYPLTKQCYEDSIFNTIPDYYGLFATPLMFDFTRRIEGSDLKHLTETDLREKIIKVSEKITLHKCPSLTTFSREKMNFVKGIEYGYYEFNGCLVITGDIFGAFGTPNFFDCDSIMRPRLIFNIKNFYVVDFLME